MKYFVLLAVLLFPACAFATPSIAPDRPVTGCMTKCGMRFVSETTQCRTLQHLETRYLRTLAGHVAEWPYERTCQALTGWRLFVHTFTWSDHQRCSDGFIVGDVPTCVRGYTHAFTHEIELEDADWLGVVLPHEIVHALQVSLGEPVGHCDWTARGISAAIFETTGFEHSYPEAPCAPLSVMRSLR